MLIWEKLASNYFSIYRTKVPGGWLVICGQMGDPAFAPAPTYPGGPTVSTDPNYVGGITFYPDPNHEWDALARMSPPLPPHQR